MAGFELRVVLQDFIPVTLCEARTSSCSRFGHSVASLGPNPRPLGALGRIDILLGLDRR